MSDVDLTSQRQWWTGLEDEHEATVQQQRSPGKRSLTMRIQPRLEGAVQRKAMDHAPAAPTSTIDSAASAHWMNAAVRPDLHGGPIQRKAGAASASGTVASGSGAAMPKDVQAKMEGAFDTDFSAVRIHEGDSAASIGAQAYTQGTDIHFAAGQYNPTSQSGQELLGHELTHVVQQSTGQVSASRNIGGIGVNDDSGLEREADELGARAARGDAGVGGASSSATAVSSGATQRKVAQRKVVQRVATEESAGSGDLGGGNVPADIIAHLRLREGWREDVYLDSEGKPTAGLGHLMTSADLQQYKVGDTVPVATLEAWAQADSKKAYDAAKSQASTLGVASASFVGALTSVNFQLGTAWNTIHKKTWGYMVEGKWEKAAAEAQDSKWYSQTPVRVQDFQAALRELAAGGTGEKAETTTGDGAGSTGESTAKPDATSTGTTEQVPPAEQSLFDRMSNWLDETADDVMEFFGFGSEGGSADAQTKSDTPTDAPVQDFVANGVRGCDYVVRADQTIVYMSGGTAKREFPVGHKLYAALKTEILEKYPDVPAWTGASNTPASNDNANTNNDNANDKTSGSDNDNAVAPKGDSKYYTHPNADKVSLSYGANAVKLNADADHLIRSILAGAGLSSGYISSTLRTYADQARINYEQNSGDQIKSWYGADVYATWSKYKKEGKTTADYAKYLEDRDKKRGKTISNHIPGFALDVAPHNSTFSNFAETLVPVAGSGVRKILVEKKCTHTEFTFQVT